MTVEQENQKPLKYTLTEEKGESGIDYLCVQELKKRLPIFDFRNLDHHQIAAKMLARGSTIAMYGGVWAVIKTEKRYSHGGELFWNIKVPQDKSFEVEPRPEEARPPTFGRPEDYIHRIDWDKHHPHFREVFGNISGLVEIWRHLPGYAHGVAALKQSAKSYPGRFVTKAKHFKERYPDFPPIGVDTIADFWSEDPFVRHFATCVSRYSHTEIHTAVSTLNFHGYEPPFEWEEFKEDIKNGKIRIDLIDAILKDHLPEQYKALASHLQFIFGPPQDRKPKAYVIREGDISVEFLREMFSHFGVQVEVYPGAKDTKKIKGVSLDGNLIAMRQKADEEFTRQKPKIASRMPYLTNWLQHGKVPQILENLRLDRI